MAVRDLEILDLDLDGKPDLLQVTESTGAAGLVSVLRNSQSEIVGVSTAFTGKTIVFEPGQTSQNVTITIVDDSVVNNDRNIPLALVDTMSTPSGTAATNPPTATLTVQDNEIEIFLTSANYGVAEDGTNAVITVSRNGGITQTANVLFSTVSGGTAIDGINYIGRSQLLTFGPSVTSQTVAIPVIDDTAVNTDRTVNMQLSNPSGPFGTQRRP